MFEVFVARMQHQRVLQDERRQPHVVRRNRSALLSQLPEDRRIVVRRLIVCEEDPYATLRQESAEDPFVLDLAPTMCETCTQLAEHDEWQHDAVGLFHERDRVGNAATEIDVGVGIQGHSHRQSASST